MATPGTPLIADDVFELVAQSYAAFQLGENSFIYRVLTVSAGMTDQQVVNAWSTLAGPYYKDVMPPSAKYYGAYGRLIYRLGLSPSAYPNAKYSANETGDGLVSDADLLPTNNTVIINRYSEKKGPAGRGRIFAPFVPNTFVNPNGSLTTDALDAYEEIGVGLMNAITLTDGGMSIDLQGYIRRVYTDATNDVSSTWTNPILSSLHKRGPRGHMDPPPRS